MRHLTNFLKLRAIRALLLSVLALSMPLSALRAQNISISPQSGHLIAGLGDALEVGFDYGWKSLWWHNQLPLKLWISDEAELTADGFPLTQGCNFANYTDANGVTSLVMSSMSGSGNAYILASLPDGYRFTGYEITLVNDLTGTIVGKTFGRRNEWNFYETDNTFNTATAYQSTTLGSARSNTEYTISRTSMQKSDMDHNLYFVFHGNNSGSGDSKRALVRVKHFVIYFAADGNFTTPIVPSYADSRATSFRTVTFPTGKIALGDIRKRRQEGKTNLHFAYEYHEVEELDANMLLYNEGSIVNDSVNHVASAATITQEVENDGTAQQAHYYGLKNGTYYIESPTEVITSHGNHDPVGYRIIGGKLHYHLGTAQEAVEKDEVFNEKKFTISATLPIDGDAANGTMTYFLHPSGRFVRQQVGDTHAKMWQMDDAGRIYHYQDGEYSYLEWYQRSTGGTYTISVYRASTPPNQTYTGTNNTRSSYYHSLFNIAQGTNNLRFGTNNSRFVQAEWNSDLAGYKLTQSATAGTTVAKMFSVEETVPVSQPAYTPQPWTLTVYDKDGAGILETVQVNAGNPDGTIDLAHFNNDAVKFSISGLPADDAANNYRALITADVEMVGLDPYITSLDIVCENSLKDNPNVPEREKRAVQSFASADFSVYGGAFKFYVPNDWDREGVMPCTFSFQNLHTHYLDETYYDNTDDTKYGRDVLVGSEYYGLTPDKSNVVLKNLYDISEPAASGDDVDYARKVQSYLCGTQPYYFSNADELDHDIATNDIRTLHQYRFSLDRYRNEQDTVHRRDADGHVIVTGQLPGDFTTLTMSKDDSKYAYLFVCDEPRYNIAPSRGTQHRLYSYYDMEIQLITRDYEPLLEWKKVYNEIQYANSPVKEKAQWGLIVKTVQDDDDDPGYLPISLITEEVDKALAASDGTTCPTSLDQIIYVDASNLSTIVYSSNSGVKDNAIDAFRKKLSPNCLFYLPHDMELFADNFAYQRSDGTFHACRNIVLTDRKPFFAPYDIHVEAPDYASYSRGITIQGYNKVTYGTLLLPFALSLDAEGIHTDSRGRSAFSLFEMNATNALSLNKSELNSGAVGYFSNVQSTNVIGESEANVPYLFEVKQKTDNPTTTLIAEQEGTVVKATPVTRENTMIQKLTQQETVGGSDWDDWGWGGGTGGTTVNYTAKGSITSTTTDWWGDESTTTTNYYLTHTGSYSGAVIPKKQGAFYMAQGKFLNTLSLNNGLDALNMLPFRSWYSCQTSDKQAPSLAQIFIDFGDNPDIPTGIKTTHADNRLYVVPGQGMLTLLADSNVAADIYSIDGTHVSHVNLSAGLQHVEYIPAGVYIVNQQKVIVR